MLIYVTTINQLFWKLTKEKFTLHEVNLGGAAYLQSFINNATYDPMKPDADVMYQAVNLFSSDKFFYLLHF